MQAFLPHGYDGVTICCLDPDVGVPRHYHQSSDKPENLDYDQLVACVDLAERIIDNIIRHKLGG